MLLWTLEDRNNVYLYIPTESINYVIGQQKCSLGQNGHKKGGSKHLVTFSFFHIVIVRFDFCISFSLILLFILL